MLSYRVSDQTRYLGMVYQYNSLLNQQLDLQNQISTGISLQRADQDPVATALSELGHTQDTQMTQDQRNITGASSFASTTETTLNTVMDNLQRAEEVAVGGGDSSKSAGDLQQYAAEVNQMINGLVSTANGQFDNKNLFGGSATDPATPAFKTTLDASGNVTNVTYQGNTDQLQTVAAPGVTVQYNLLGANAGTTNFGVFQDTNVADTGSALGHIDLFHTLIQLRDDLQGNPAGLSADIQSIQNVVAHLNNAITLTGSAQQRLQDQQTSNQDLQTSIETTVSKYEDTDMAAAISKLSILQTSYQAALKIGAEVSQVSLLDYIR